MNIHVSFVWLISIFSMIFFFLFLLNTWSRIKSHHFHFFVHYIIKFYLQCNCFLWLCFVCKGETLTQSTFFFVIYFVCFSILFTIVECSSIDYILFSLMYEYVYENSFLTLIFFVLFCFGCFFCRIPFNEQLQFWTQFC